MTLTSHAASVEAAREKKRGQRAAPVGAALLQSDRDTKPVFKFESLSNPHSPAAQETSLY